jgi:hypothetical protein
MSKFTTPMRDGVRSAAVAEAINLARTDEGIEAAVAALASAVPLDAQMIQMERMSMAVGSTLPKYHLYLSSARGMSHGELAASFNRLVTAIHRRTGKPVIYWGVFGNGFGDGGEHIHLLLWKKPKMKVWHTERKKVGIGWARSKPVEPGMKNALKAAAYVGGQQVSVFGSREHDSAASRRNERSWVMPHDATLRKHHPELLKATRAAQDPAITDAELFASLPRLFEPLTPYQKGCVAIMVADSDRWRGRRGSLARRWAIEDRAHGIRTSAATRVNAVMNTAALTLPD